MNSVEQRLNEIRAMTFKPLDFDEKVDWVKQLLRANENDLMNATHFKTGAMRAAAAHDLLKEKELLEEQLEQLTGKKTLAVDDLASTLPPDGKKKDDDGDKGPVRV